MHFNFIFFIYFRKRDQQVNERRNIKNYADNTFMVCSFIQNKYYLTNL